MAETEKNKEIRESMNDNDRMIYVTVANHYLEYVKLFWTRQNTFITINGGMFALLAFFVSAGESDPTPEKWIISLGFLVTLFWLFTGITTRKWITKLRSCVKDATEKIDRHDFYMPFFAEVNKPGPQVSQVTLFVPAVVGLFWIAAFCYIS